MENNKLTKLIISKEDINEDIIYNILSPNLSVLKEEKKIIPKKEFLKLNQDEKILIWLLGIKAMKELKIIEKEEIGPKEICEQTNIKIGSVKPILRGLEERGWATSSKGKYRITDFGILELNEKWKKKT